MFKALTFISKKVLVVSVVALFLFCMLFFGLPGKIYGATLLETAEAAVAALETAAAANLTVEANLLAAEALVAPTQAAVATASGELGIAAISARLATAIGTVTAARTAFDLAAATAIDAIFDGLKTTLASLGIYSNIDRVNSTNYHSFSGLYFEKYTDINDDNTIIGALTFNGALDLGNSYTQALLQNLGTLLIINPGSLSFNASTATLMKEADAEITMYGINALGFTNVPTIIVKDDLGNILSVGDAGYPTLSNQTYHAAWLGGALTFNTDHFSQFTIIAGGGATTPKPLTPEEQVSLNLSIAEQVSLYGASNTGFTKMLYDNILGRVSDAGGLDDWVTALNNGTITLGDVVYGFVFSDELEPMISAFTNEEFITFLYENVLDRNADPNGYAGWVSAMNSGMSKEEVLLHFIDSDEFRSICEMFGLTA